MSALVFKSRQNVQKMAPEFASIAVQTAMWGRPIPIVYGQTRVAGNLVWYNDFQAIAQTQRTGGKGGGGHQSTTSYTYQAAAILSLCEGSIYGVPRVWAGKTVTTPGALNFTLFAGGLGQAIWSYLTTNHPDQAIPYNHCAYLANPAYDLGDSSSLPNHTFELVAYLTNSTGVSNIVDAAPELVTNDLLVNPFYGIGFPSAKMGPLTQLGLYCRSHGIWVSPNYSEQETGADIISRMADLTNTALVYSEGILKFIPYGDVAYSGNGVTFFPVTTVWYNITDNDLMSTDEQNPVVITRSANQDAYNCVRVTFCDRTQDYASAPQEAKETNSIQKYGLRVAPPIEFKEICDPAAARMVAQLALQRIMYQRNMYAFTVGMRFCLLEPMDLVNLNEGTGTPATGLTLQLTTIEETEDGVFNMEAQDWFGTVHTAPVFQYQTKGGYSLNLLAPPGSINQPLIIDAPSQLAATGYELWMMVAGSNPYWGGANVWISTDGSSYKNIGVLKARARYGTLTNALAATADPDTTDATAVDLTTSLGAIASGTQAQADLLNTLCYVGNGTNRELISYTNATLTAPYKYTLDTYLRRGLYGSPIANHAVGESFARLDSGAFKYAYDPGLIGTTVYFKFTSVNVWGGAEEALSGVHAYAYTVLGPMGAPGDVAGLTATVTSSGIQLNWKPVGTPNLYHYEVRQGGTDWNSATYVATSLTTQLNVAPQPAGLQTWWVKALDHGGAYSQDAASVSLSIVAPSAVSVSPLIVDNNIQLSWTAAVSTQPILTYEVRRSLGSAPSLFASAPIVGSKNGLFTTIIESAAGTNTYWVVAIDIGGNYGTPTSVVCTISAPPDYILALFAPWPNKPSAGDRNSGILGTNTLTSANASSWGSIRSTTGYCAGVWYWEMHIDATVLATVIAGIGTASAGILAGSYVGLDSFGYGYYAQNGNVYHGGAGTAQGAACAPGDVIGILLDCGAGTVKFSKNGVVQGAAIALPTGQTWFPMFSLFTAGDQVTVNLGDHDFVTAPAATANGLASNAMLDHGVVVMPVDVTTTYQAHFTNAGWTSPNDQINASFEEFIEKSVSAGYYEQVFDTGQSLQAAKVTVNPNFQVADGLPSTSVDISTSLDNVTYVTTTGVTTLFGTNFRYVKVRLNATSAGGDDLVQLLGFSCVVEVKIKSDFGTINCVASDSGGTNTTFNYPFLSVTSINLTPEGSTAIIPTVKFTPVANPTSFKSLLFNTSGTRISGLARWEAKGY